MTPGRAIGRSLAVEALRTATSLVARVGGIRGRCIRRESVQASIFIGDPARLQTFRSVGRLLVVVVVDFATMFLITAPTENVHVGWLNILILELSELELVGFVLDEPLVSAHVISDGCEESSPRSGDDIFAVVVTAHEDDLSPLAGRTRGEIDADIVAAPVAGHWNPSGVDVCFLNGIRRLRILL